MLARCRQRVPGVAISSDFIVGFCGETEKSFERSCDLVATAGFKNSFIFKYSSRPGTKGAELFADDVAEEVKKRRNNDLLAIQSKVSLADHRQHIGQTVQVLVEGRSKNALKHREGHGPVQLTGRTPTDHIVVFEGNERLTGETIPVKIQEATAFTLFGTVETDEQLGATARYPDATARREEPGRISLPLL
jgi:tRNA-2-methylthio-N6-dimethylallyladenosine synthase